MLASCCINYYFRGRKFVILARGRNKLDYATFCLNNIKNLRYECDLIFVLDFLRPEFEPFENMIWLSSLFKSLLYYKTF